MKVRGVWVGFLRISLCTYVCVSVCVFSCAVACVRVPSVVIAHHKQLPACGSSAQAGRIWIVPIFGSFGSFPAPKHTNRNQPKVNLVLKHTLKHTLLTITISLSLIIILIYSHSVSYSFCACALWHSPYIRLIKAVFHSRLVFVIVVVTDIHSA